MASKTTQVMPSDEGLESCRDVLPLSDYEYRTNFILLKTQTLKVVRNVIRCVLKSLAVQKDQDVEQLYLSNRNLTEICDLNRFRYLRYLWLNGNKLRRLDCLQDNFRLAELYLENNELTDITGALCHLTCLNVLMLHNNQLTKLFHVLREFSKMSNLKTLNLFNNPLAQHDGYRLLAIHSVPSVDLLDRQEVLLSERDQASKIFTREDNKIAFGRRSDGPPLPGTGEQLQTTICDTKEYGNSFAQEFPPFGSMDEAMRTRRLKKSVTLYTCFDWSKVPRIEERRTASEPFDSPEIVTHIYI